MKRVLTPFLLLLLAVGGLFAQDTVYNVKYKIVDGDTIPMFSYTYNEPVKFEMTAEEMEKLKAWNLLLQDIDILMPLVLEWKAKMAEVDAKLEEIKKKRHERDYIDAEIEKALDEYWYRLTQMSVRRGGVLIKLMHRETGLTPYEVMKKYKNNFFVARWEAAAKLAGLNIRETYDPEIDFLIEQALKEKGYQ